MVRESELSPSVLEMQNVEVSAEMLAFNSHNPKSRGKLTLLDRNHKRRWSPAIPGRFCSYQAAIRAAAAGTRLPSFHWRSFGVQVLALVVLSLVSRL